MSNATRYVTIALSLLLTPAALLAQADPHDDPHADPHEHHAEEVKLSAAAVAEYGIRIESASERVLAPTFAAPARLSFDLDAMAHIGSAVRGRVAEVKVRVGDKVRKGDELLVIESPELGAAQSEFLQAHTAVSVAESAVEPAQAAWERAKALYEKSEGIALAEVQKRDAERRTAKGALDSAVAHLQATQNALTLLGMTPEQIDQLASDRKIDPRYVVRAPIDGQVVEREITLGELVSPDKEALMVLADTRSLWALVDVPEARLGQVAMGGTVVIGTGAMKHEGVVAMIAAQVNPDTRSGEVRVVVPNSSEKLRAGMFAAAMISIATDKPAAPVLAIPEEALQTVEGAPSVFVPVKDEPNTFAVRNVNVGKPVGGMVAVLKGLEPGEKLVVAGSFILKAEHGKSGAAHVH